MMGAVESAGQPDAAAVDGPGAAAGKRAVAQRLDVDLAFMLVDLANGRALTESQARRLYTDWFVLEDDAWSQPWLRGVGEHSRMYIECFGSGGTPV
jgi:hypothetical protein